MNKIICGDSVEVLKGMPNEIIDMCITSPPYFGLRDYGADGQIGLEYTIKEYIDRLIAVFDEVKRVLRPTGTCWVNLGDSYGGNTTSGPGHKELPNTEKLPDKCLLQIPARFSIAMTDSGWILRNTIIWHKPNSMPSSAKDRFTNDFEYLFFFTKNKKYYFNQQFDALKQSSIERAIRKYKDGKTNKYNGLTAAKQRKYADKITRGIITTRNRRAVWSINTANKYKN